MSGRDAEADIASLAALGERRERRAAASLRTARGALAEIVRQHDEQQARVDALLAEIERLNAWRLRSLSSASAQDLRDETERRRWLMFDLGKERFYLDEAKGHLERATAEVERCRLAWLRVRERRDALGTLGARHRQTARRAELRRDEAASDDRRPTAQLQG